MKETLESVAYCKAHNIVKSWSDDNLLSVWEAATSRYASPEDGWGTNIDELRIWQENLRVQEPKEELSIPEFNEYVKQYQERIKEIVANKNP